MKSGSVKLGKEKAAETASETDRARHELPFSLAAATHSAPTASISLSSDAQAGSCPALSGERIVGGMGGEGDRNPEQKQVGGEVEPSHGFQIERNSVSSAKRNSTAPSQNLKNSVERHSVEEHSSQAKRNLLTVASSSSALASKTVSPFARVSHSDVYTPKPTLTQPSAAAVVSLVPDCRLSAACVCCYMFVCVLNFYLDLHNYDCLQYLSPPFFLFYMLMLS